MDSWDKKKKNTFLSYWMAILPYVEKKMRKFVGLIANISLIYLAHVVREYWLVHVSH